MSGGSLIRRVVLAGLATLCLPASAQADWSSSVSGNTATMTNGGPPEQLTIDATPTLLSHNALANPGFSGATDFETVAVAVTTTVANDASHTVAATAGPGADPATVGTGTVPASQVQAAFDYDGGGDTDSLTFENAADTVVRSYVVGDGTIDGHGGGPVTYANVETLVVNTGGNADTIGVLSPVPATVNVDGNGGDDRLAPQDGLLPLPNFDGDAGSDTYDFGAFTSPVTFAVPGAGNASVENVTGGTAGDNLTGDGGPNTIAGGTGADSMAAQADNDFIAAVDGVADASINCGDGPGDVANIDAGVDPEPVGCETVNRISGGGPEDPGGGADTDNDGVPDAADACPNVAGSPSNNGCPPPTAADRDGDGTADAADRCPDRAGSGSDGCPRLARELSIDRRKGAYKGKLSADPATDACTDDQKVTVYRKVKGDDDKIGKDRTDAKGKYEVEGSGRDGKYYARAEDADEAPEAVCLAVKSKNLKVG